MGAQLSDVSCGCHTGAVDPHQLLCRRACGAGDVEEEDLVRRGISPNRVDTAGWTPLHVATCMGRQDVSLYLLQSGAKLQAKNVKGQTPEDLCSHVCTKEVVSIYRANSARTGPATEVPSTPGYPTRVDVEGRSSLGLPRSVLHFEPFFVPREAVVHEPAIREELQRIGLAVFDHSPGHGLAFLVASGVVRDYPVEINSFLVKVGAHAGMFGDFLGEEYPIAQTLRLEFLNSLPLHGTGVTCALETAFHEIDVPSDWLKIDRLTCGIAHFWWRQHEEEQRVSASEGKGATGRVSAQRQSPQSKGEPSGLELQRCLLGTDSLHRLMFSAIMLHTWLNSDNRMSLGQWIELNTGIEGNGNDVPVHIQRSVYNTISEGRAIFSKPRSPKVEDLLPMCGGWAFVHCNGRATNSVGPSPPWSDASPRILAEQGGASSVGCSLPAPAAQQGECKPAAGLLEQVRSLEQGDRNGETTWLMLHQSLLLLSSEQGPDCTPYGFASLRHVVLRRANAESKTIVLTGRSEPSWQTPDCSNDDPGWLELCLLLGDGRFQCLEAPELELRLRSDSDFEAWTDALRDVCYDNGGLHKATKADMRMPPFNVSTLEDDIVDLQVPAEPSEPIPVVVV